MGDWASFVLAAAARGLGEGEEWSEMRE